MFLFGLFVQAKYDEAQPLRARAMAINESALEADHEYT